MQAQCLGSARWYCPTLGVPWVSRGCAFTWYLEVDLSKWTSCADFEQNDAISLSVKLYWRRLIYSLKLCVCQTRARVIGIYYCDLIMQASCYIWFKEESDMWVRMPVHTCIYVQPEPMKLSSTFQMWRLHAKRRLVNIITLEIHRGQWAKYNGNALNSDLLIWFYFHFSLQGDFLGADYLLPNSFWYC